MDEIIEQANLLHRMTVAKAQQTGLDSDWNDAQSIEHQIAQLKAFRTFIKETGRKLGIYQGVLQSLHTLHTYSAPFQLMQREYPDLYKEIVDGSTVNSNQD